MNNNYNNDYQNMNSNNMQSQVVAEQPVPQQALYYPQQPKEHKSNIISILLIVSIVICMVACFFPYFEIGGYSINYIYNDKFARYSESGGIADGIFIYIFGIISILTILIGKKRVPAVICQLLAAGIYIMDFANGQSSIMSSLITKSYSYGFYIIFIFIIISVILSIIRLVAKDKFS